MATKSIRPRSDTDVQSGLRGILNVRRLRGVTRSVDKVSNRLVALVALAYLVLTVSFGFKVGVVLTVAFMAIVWVIKRVIRNTQLAIALVSLLVTLVTMGIVAPSVVSYGQVVHPSAFFVAVAAVPGAFMTARHQGNRGMTAVIVHVGCVFLTFLSAFTMDFAGVAVVVWGAVVIMWRCGFGLWLRVAVARHRSGFARPDARLLDIDGVRDRIIGFDDWVEEDEAFQDDFVERGASAEEDTAKVALGLPPQWSLLVSRRLPDTRADLDLVAIGPAGAWTIDSKDWSGRISRHRVGDPTTGEVGYEYRLNGSADKLIERVQSSAFEATRLARTLRLSPEQVGIVVCFSDRMSLDDDWVSMQIEGLWSDDLGQEWNPVIHLVKRDALVEFLTSQPDVSWRRPTRAQAYLAKRRGVPQDQLQQVVDAQAALDLAVVADYALIPS